MDHLTERKQNLPSKIENRIPPVALDAVPQTTNGIITSGKINLIQGTGQFVFHHLVTISYDRDYLLFHCVYAGDVCTYNSD